MMREWALQTPTKVLQHGHVKAKGLQTACRGGAHDAANMDDGEYNAEADRDQRLNYLQLLHIEAVLRRQMLQLESLSSHRVERLQDAQSPVLLATRALEGSLLNLQHILRGNIALIEKVKRMSQPPKFVVPAGNHQRFDCSEACDWINLTESKRSSSSEHTPETWSISSPSEAFTEASSRYTDNPSSFVLRYHPDMAQLSGPKPFASSNAASLHPPSRRVIMSNLPPDATAAQVLQGIRCYGGIKSITMLPLKPFCSGSTLSALVDFVYARSAADYARAVCSHALLYEDQHRLQYRASAWLVPTASYPHSQHEHELLAGGQTRAIMVRNLPKAATWYFLRAVGMDTIVGGRRVENPCGLVVELTTMVGAGRLVEGIAGGRFAGLCHGRAGYMYEPVTCANVTDSSQVARDFVFRGGTIRHVPDDFLGRQWDRDLFNDYRGDEGHGRVVTPDALISLARSPSPAGHDGVNLSHWERYGVLARQRRQLAEAQGMEEGKVPDGCGDVKSSAVPAMVKKYLDTSRKIVYANGR